MANLFTDEVQDPIMLSELAKKEKVWGIPVKTYKAICCDTGVLLLGWMRLKEDLIEVKHWIPEQRAAADQVETWMTQQYERKDPTQTVPDFIFTAKDKKGRVLEFQTDTKGKNDIDMDWTANDNKIFNLFPMG